MPQYKIEAVIAALPISRSYSSYSKTIKIVSHNDAQYYFHSGKHLRICAAVWLMMPGVSKVRLGYLLFHLNKYRLSCAVGNIEFAIHQENKVEHKLVARHCQ